MLRAQDLFPALETERECQAGHASQRVKMLLKRPRTRLHHSHLQLFGLLPLSLIPKPQRQVGNRRESLQAQCMARNGS